MSTFDLQPLLKGDLIELHPLKTDDFENLYRAASDPLIWKQHPCSDRYKEDVFRNFFAEALASKGAFAVINTKTRKIIGCTRYYELDVEKGQIVIGYTFLEREYWGGKYNSEMKSLLLTHAFKYVPTVLFHVDDTNMRSRKAMEKIGGRTVGEIKKVQPDGQTRTSLIYALQRTIA